MTVLTLPSAEPVSSGEFQIPDLGRIGRVERRHETLRELLAHSSFDGLLLTDPANLAWLTAGSRLQLHGQGEQQPAVFLTPEARLLVCTSSESGQLFDREINGLGFQLKERPWEEPRHVLLDDLTRGRRVACDHGRPGCGDVARELLAIRGTLDEDDAAALRTVGAETAQAVEATCRTFERGQSEAEIAGQLTHRLLRHGLQPTRIQVLADAQGHRYRHWSFGPDPVERSLVLSVTARRDGLHASCGRTVTFGEPSQTIRDAHQVACLVQATGLYFTRPGLSAEDVWPKVARIYEKFGAADEWREAPQAAVTGYAPREYEFTPRAGFRLHEGMAVHWHPSVRTAMVGDTMVCRQGRVEVVTAGDHWPQLPVVVKGTTLPRPGILVRDEATEWAVG